MVKTEPDYNAVATALLEPFDDSQISEREGSGGKSFSFVAPEHYRRRLLRVFKEGFEFHVRNVEVSKTGIRGQAHFRGTHSDSGVAYDFELPVFEPWKIGRDFLWNEETKKYDKPNPKAGQILDPEHTFSALASAGIKACAREMGLGLHLYDKAPSTGTRSKSSAATNSGSASTSSASNGTWTGDDKIPFGKHKDTPWNKVDDGYLAWVVNKMDDPAKSNAQKEIARRQGAAATEGAKNAQDAIDNASADELEDDIPFN